MADPYGTGDGGLLGGFQGFSPLTNFGLGLLSQSGPSLTPQSPWQAVGRAAQYTSEAQQQAMQNQLIRAKLAESARETAGQKALEEAVTSGKLPLPEGMTTEAATALFRASPELASKAYLGTVFPTALTPQDKIQLMLTQAQIAKLVQEQGATAGETVSEPVAQLGNISTIADASQRLDEAGSIFTPGGLIEKAGGLDLAAAGLTTANQLGYGGETTKKLLGQVTDAQTVSKATAALAQSLQGASGSSSRSAYALRNIQTALGQNMIWPAKRRILVQNLKVVFADTEAQPGLKDKIPGYQDAKDLYEKLNTQDEAFTKQAGAPAQAAVQAAPEQAPAPGGVPGFSMMPPGAEAAPPAPAAAPSPEAARKTPTLSYDATGRAMFNRDADLQRAIKNGWVGPGTRVIVNGVSGTLQEQ